MIPVFTRATNGAGGSLAISHYKDSRHGGGRKQSLLPRGANVVVLRESPRGLLCCTISQSGKACPSIANHGRRLLAIRPSWWRGWQTTNREKPTNKGHRSTREAAERAGTADEAERQQSQRETCTEKAATNVGGGDDGARLTEAEGVVLRKVCQETTQESLGK